MKHLFTIICALLFSIGYSQTQDSIANTILQKIRMAPGDSLKIDLELQLADRTRLFDLDTSRTIINNIIETIKHKNYQSYYYKQQKANALNALGMFDLQQDKTEVSLSHYLSALDIFETIQDSTGIGSTLDNLGKFYTIYGDYAKSKQYFRDAIVIWKLIEDANNLGLSYQKLADALYYDDQIDSSLIYINKAKALPITSKRAEAEINSTMAGIHYSNGALDKAIKIFQKNIAIFKAFNDKKEVSASYSNVAFVFSALGNYEEASHHLDSAIFNAKEVKDVGLLVLHYRERSDLYRKQKKYAKALEDYKIYKTYYDSINDTKKAKRITALELNHKFDKEKLADQLIIENEASKRKLYFLLFILTMVLGIAILWLVKKNARQRLKLSENKLEKEQLDKLKGELVLLTRENELKRAVIENSLRQEVLHKTLDRIKQIIKLENPKERNKELKSLWATLLSEKTTKTTSENLQAYLNKVSMDFKIILNTKFTVLSEKEKEILCFMTLDLTAVQISELLNTTLSSIKSTRHRIRKKLLIDSNKDIIAFIRSAANTSISR
ncbi:tetratricopeptide repeat protein [uncultured Psychroserpens sp.]|uniref:tetratricopeptide repeat protein n=1 Tax=uncultured Psychroserpens sp. TaxID=255436 RepID=UPI002616D48F|nr:tetratricopeptide repeat protein [uncultured Psychroserpens sp.]